MAKNFDNCSNENNENKKLKLNDQDFEQLDEFNQSKKLEKGKWYTHLSLPIEFNDKNTDLIQSVIENMDKEFQNKATLLDEFHISVSRLLIIKNSLYKPICDSITNIFKLQSTSSINLDQLVVLRSNDPQKFFMAFKIDAQNESLLNDIIKNVDVCLKSFGLPAYYKNPTFHVSFAYFFIDASIEYLNIKKFAEDYNKRCMVNNSEDKKMTIKMDRLKIKCGNNLFFHNFNSI